MVAVAKLQRLPKLRQHRLDQVDDLKISLFNSNNFSCHNIQKSFIIIKIYFYFFAISRLLAAGNPSEGSKPSEGFAK